MEKQSAVGGGLGEGKGEEYHGIPQRNKKLERKMQHLTEVVEKLPN